MTAEAFDAAPEDDYPVHPAAECFRLMYDEELESLAADIAEHGLRDPITLGRVNGEISLVDGRNRYRACRIAGVDPDAVIVDFKDDDEVRAFVASRGQRRNVTKGEHAMALALLHPGGQGKKDDAVRASAISAEVSMRRIQQARQVLRHSRDFALAVRDGALTLDEALGQARRKQDELQSDAEKLADLQAFAPDLAELVQEERLKLTEAHATYQQRVREAAEVEQNKRETILRLTESAYRGATAWAVEDFADAVRERLDDPDFRTALIARLRPSQERNNLRDLAAGITALSRTLKGLLQ